MLIVKILVILGLVAIFTDSVLIPFLEKKFPFFIINIGDAIFNYGDERINRKKVEKLLQKRRAGTISKQQIEQLYEILIKIDLSSSDSCKNCYSKNDCEKNGYCREYELFCVRENIGIELRKLSVKPKFKG